MTDRRPDPVPRPPPRAVLRWVFAKAPARYVVVGALCASVNWALMLLVDRDRYLVSSLVLFVPIGTLGFLLHAFWTFREEPSVRSWLAYLVGMLPGGAVSLAILAVMRDVVGLPLAIALPATVLAMTALNYLVARATIAGLAPRHRGAARRRAARVWKRVARIARGVYRQVKPHVRGRTIPIDRDWSLAVPFAYDLSDAPPPRLPLAVVCHLYYPDLAGELRDAIANIPYEAEVFVSTDTDEKRRRIETAFAGRPGCVEGSVENRVEVRVLPNRGRDIAPKLVGFRDVFETHDLVLMLHGKKTPDFDKGDAWRRTLFETLAGSPDKVRAIVETFRLDPRVGMVICQHFEPIRRFVGWHHHFETARSLARRMGVSLTPRHVIDLPSGSMFWARSAAMRPLLDLGLTFEDFPEERGQTNGTLAHVVERLFLYACEAAGYRWVKIADPALSRHPATIATTRGADDVLRFIATKSTRLLPTGGATRDLPRVVNAPGRPASASS